MGIAVNLVTYLTGTMHLHSAASANIVTDFMGTSFLLCLLGGFLADSFIGRYMTIAIFATVQGVVRSIIDLVMVIMMICLISFSQKSFPVIIYLVCCINQNSYCFSTIHVKNLNSTIMWVLFFSFLFFFDPTWS